MPGPDPALRMTGTLPRMNGYQSPVRCNMNRANVTSDAVLFIEGNTEKSAPITRLIAYLSVCMLAGAFGATVGPTWSQWWAIFGAFGLASAVGLDVVNRSRTRQADRRRQKAARTEGRTQAGRNDRRDGVVRCNSRRLASIPIGRHGSHAPRHQRSGRAEAASQQAGDDNALCSDPAGRRVTGGESLSLGRVRNISRYGFGLAHDQRLERGFVLLEVDVANAMPLQFIARRALVRTPG